MSKPLSLVVLMIIVAMYACVAALANLTFQLKTYEINRNFALSAYWLSVVLQVISAPFLMRLSDSIGRNAVMTISFIGILFGLINMLFANSLIQLCIGYVILGVTSTGSGCFNAYCSDQNLKYRAEIFTTAMAAWALGFVGATVIHDMAYQVNESRPVYIGIMIAAAGTALTLFLLPNSLNENNRTPFDLKEANMIGASRALFADRRTTMLAIAVFLFFLGMRAYTYVQIPIFRTHHEGVRQLTEVVNMQQLGTILIAILAFVFILWIGKTKTVIVTSIISIAGMVGIIYTPIQLERMVMFMPFIGNIAGSIFLAAIVDKTAPDRYGVIFGGITGLTVIAELIASGNMKLFEYFKETSPQDLFLCVVIPAMILLLCMAIFVSVRKEDLREVS
jgi:DHA1 family tetracycline resistance protein-like MFS transporter